MSRRLPITSPTSGRVAPRPDWASRQRGWPQSWQARPQANRVRRALLAAAVGACAGCEDGIPDPLPSAPLDSAGITIVENPGPDRPAPWTSREVRPLVPPDSSLTARPWAVAVDPRTGRVYVADATEPRIVSFDRDGRYVASWSREGRGPGELINPSAATMGPDGTLTIWDTGRGILSRWSSNGELVEEVRAPAAYWGPAFHQHSRGLITVTVNPEPGRMDQMLVEIVDGRSRTLSTVPRELVMVELPCMSQPTSRIFAPNVVWAGAGEGAHVLRGPEYRIDSFSGGSPRRSIRRDIPLVRVTAAVARARAGEHRGLMQLCGLSAEEVVRAVGFEEEVSPVQWISVSPDARLWVTRSLDGVPPIQVDVFDPFGAYEGTLSVGALPIGWISATRFVGFAVEPGTGDHRLSLHEIGPGEFQECGDCPVMLELPAGRFGMGASDGDLARSRSGRPEWTVAAELPRVQVDVTAFAMGKFPVTFREWDACVEAGGCAHRPDDRGWGRGDRPVIHVSRDDAGAYAAWLSERTGERYRLPSEAEWEYAARAGTTTARWWGDDLGLGRAACDGCGSEWDDQSTAPVGSFPPNRFGLHDMLGNVSEWVADCWHDDHGEASRDGSARVDTSPWWESGSCQRPVVRGGSWASFPWAVRAARRGYYWEFPGAPWSERDSRWRGFRVARDVAPIEWDQAAGPSEARTSSAVPGTRK